MRRSVLLLSVLALLLLTAALAPFFKSDPGIVLIHFRQWTIETSVLVLAGAVILLWLGAQLVLWMYRLPAETARRVRERRALVQLEKGLLALTEGDWRTAEKALQKSASGTGRNTAHYLAAAQAADGQDAGERREFYLEQADSGGKHKRFLVELTRARMLLANGHADEALPVLEDLAARRKAHAQVLELLARCYRELGRWHELQELLPRLRKAEVMSEGELDELQLGIARSKLLEAPDADQLNSAWRALPRAMQRDPAVVEVFAERAGALQRSDLAEDALRSALKRDWNARLVLRYGDPGAGNASQRLKQCEQWLQEHPEDAALHMALGRLCAGQELWGKARHHLVKSLEYEPSAVGYDALGQLLDRQGELHTAMVCYRNALHMSQGKAPEPLPTDPARLMGAKG
jgi:HemY protein